jgi:YgiT-type zinc finger domain-containing protein
MMIKKCYFCKAEVIDQLVTIDYRWGDDLMVVKDVPAGVCQQCGEKYLSGEVYKELEKLAKNKNRVKDQITVDVLDFESSTAA